MTKELFHIVMIHDDGRIAAYMSSARIGHLGGPWVGERSQADLFSRDEALRGAADWNDYAATKGTGQRFGTVPEGGTHTAWEPPDWPEITGNVADDDEF